MLFHLFEPLAERISGFRLFTYITFRGAFAAILAFLVATVVGPGIVHSLRKRRLAGYSATGSLEVDEKRRKKGEVPTMGGLILLVGVALSGLLFARLDNPYTWILLLSFLAFGGLGAADDWKKLTVPGSRGISEGQKLAGQLAISLAALATLYALSSAEAGLSWLRGPTVKPDPYARRWVREHAIEAGETWQGLAARYLGDGDRAAEIARLNGFDVSDSLEACGIGRTLHLPAPWNGPKDQHGADLQVPFFKRVCVDLGILFIPLGILVIVGASNAVNLTDGLDGLAIGVTGTVAVTLTVVAYVVGRVDFSRELHLFYVRDAGELAVVGAALAGGSLGFLWFNGHPAQVFMGDTGSLAIGGILGVLAVMLRHEVTLAIAGAVFVAEALSVIWQRTYFKATRRAARRRGEPNPTGRRWFKIAPLHHHYEALGLHENKVTVRFWIVSVLCALVALASLKMR